MSTEAAEKKYVPRQERREVVRLVGILATSSTEQRLEGDWEARLLKEQLEAPRSV